MKTDTNIDALLNDVMLLEKAIDVIAWADNNSVRNSLSKMAISLMRDTVKKAYKAGLISKENENGELQF